MNAEDAILNAIDREFDSDDPTPDSILKALAAAGFAVVPFPANEAMLDVGHTLWEDGNGPAVIFDGMIRAAQGGE